MKKVAVYKIENKITRKVYIGGTTDIKRRWTNHKRNLRNNKHYNDHLQKDWNKYGEDNFKFEILEEVKDKEKLIEREAFYLGNTKHKYNIYVKISEELGWEIPEETKEKISKTNSGKNHPMYGKQHTKETKRKISEAKKGKVLSEETKRKLSEVASGKNPRSKLNKKEVLEIRKLLKKIDVKELAKKYNVSKQAIYNIKARKTWKYI